MRLPFQLSCSGFNFPIVPTSTLVRWLSITSGHFIAEFDDAALVGFCLLQMEGKVSVELFEEGYPIANEDRKN